MPFLKLSRLSGILLLIFATLGCDQATKAVARSQLAGKPGADYLGGLLRIQFAENTGAFLSLGSGMDEHSRFLMFTAGVAVFLAAASFYLFRGKGLDPWSTAGLSLLIGGGVGNLIDRMIFGHVTDFLNVGIGTLRTGIFNVADMAIILGVVFMIFAPNPKKSTGETAPG